MNTSEMSEFYDQFIEDQKEGLVLDVESYVEKRLKGHPQEEIQEIIDELKTVIDNDNLN
jgi:hypothetical protein